MLRKKCPKCGKRIKKDFSFCPNCGFNFREEFDERDYGLLGKNDDFEDLGIKLPMGFNMLFKNLVKGLDKQFRELDKMSKQDIGDIRDLNEFGKFKPIRKGFSISINSSGEKPFIKINEIGKEAKVKEIREEISKANIKKRQKSIKKMAGLPREEAETKVRRLSNKIVYEIELPGVKSINDIIINKLENSIEIKALAKNKVLVKLLPVNFPIIGYNLDKELLVLELKNR